MMRALTLMATLVLAGAGACAYAPPQANPAKPIRQ